jgi:hypothetical protein
MKKIIFTVLMLAVMLISPLSAFADEVNITSQTSGSFTVNVPDYSVSSESSARAVTGSLNVECTAYNATHFVACSWDAELTNDKIVFSNLTMSFQKYSSDGWHTIDTVSFFYSVPYVSKIYNQATFTVPDETFAQYRCIMTGSVTGQDVGYNYLPPTYSNVAYIGDAV